MISVRQPGRGQGTRVLPTEHGETARQCFYPAISEMLDYICGLMPIRVATYYLWGSSMKPIQNFFVLLQTATCRGPGGRALELIPKTHLEIHVCMWNVFDLVSRQPLDVITLHLGSAALRARPQKPLST